MPVRKLLRPRALPKADALRARLIAEWERKNSKALQPVIIEESQGASQPVHVYVIWDDWQNLTGIERSEVIMDAYEAVHGQKKGLNVSVAMGLTSAEAERMGIFYQ